MEMTKKFVTVCKISELTAEKIALLWHNANMETEVPG